MKISPYVSKSIEVIQPSCSISYPSTNPSNSICEVSFRLDSTTGNQCLMHSALSIWISWKQNCLHSFHWPQVILLLYINVVPTFLHLTLFWKLCQLNFISLRASRMCSSCSRSVCPLSTTSYPHVVIYPPALNRATTLGRHVHKMHGPPGKH